MPSFVLGLILLAAAVAVIGYAFYRAGQPSRYQRSDVSNPRETPGIRSLIGH
jgi:hypothetical protein